MLIILGLFKVPNATGEHGKSLYILQYFVSLHMILEQSIPRHHDIRLKNLPSPMLE